MRRFVMGFVFGVLMFALANFAVSVSSSSYGFPFAIWTGGVLSLFSLCVDIAFAVLFSIAMGVFFVMKS
jgi:hypothetical protein